MNEQDKMKRYHALRRRRKLVCTGFVPAALAVLVMPRLIAPGFSPALQWPLLIVFAVACVILMQTSDVCPWCGESFHSNWRKQSGGHGFRSLLRRNCANCGEPAAAGRDEA